MSEARDSLLSIGQCATLACLLEATAPKVGNVHRGADFEDLTFSDFVVSAVAIGPAMEGAASTGVGRAVYNAVAATRDLVARQYAEDFRLVLDDALPSLVAGRERSWSLSDAIIHSHLLLIGRHGDSLIARKCGAELAAKASMIAKQVLDCRGPGD